MPNNPLHNHPLTLKVKELHLLKLKLLADTLAMATHTQDPLLIDLTDYVIEEAGLDPKAVAKRLGTGHILLKHRLRGHASIAREPALATKYADTVSAMIAEQLRPLPEGM